ncbi:MAG: hypothetical protein CVU39_18770 [Chloroflexi bacterium HGW-Chloroflexi-10]|nr:MAG: hypothetical protein CVU39_18770 [Chloroflexi bacterium HGW-Chloroflexi-10]
MTNAFIEDFLAGFDDSRYPRKFLENYELMECFAHNEMGETLLIKDRRTGNYYVTKCYLDQTFRSHTTESSLLRKLDHQGLPTYIDEYQNETMLCVVRSFAQGKPLDKLVRENPLNRSQSIDIAIQLCEILEYLHGQTPPIIHRDIKPQNIIVNQQGKITLIDFGISRTYDEKLQEDTICLGTKHYAAPEQYGFSQTDGRTDIFSLGILLCWMLTGNVEVQQAKKAIPNHWLSNTISKCTAFAPKDRYKNVVQVKHELTGRALRRRIVSFLCAALIILAVVFQVTHYTAMQFQQPVGITFEEPLIEEAVRLTLNKNEGEALSEQDLLSINKLYIFGNNAAANEENFSAYAESFVNNDGTILRGNISTLNDLPKLQNLQTIALVYQNITDISPLSELNYLDYVDLRHNPIEDITPLSQAASLTSLIIYDTNVSDLTALRDCSRLSTVDAGYTKVKSPAALSGLTSLRELVLRRAPLQSLDQVETLPMLERIYLSETQLLDLSPLLALPHLQQVEVGENMRAAAEAISETAQFEIIYR